MADEDEIDSPNPSGALRKTTRFVKDPVHDYIKWSPLVSAFIDTPQFQRLRNIKQLGTSYFIWPGASHNRFEHCVGVGWLARRLAEHFQKSQPELGITDRDVQCVELAGLCHDLGHGPWSHVWDSLFIPTALPGKNWKHEDASELMFDYLLDENGITIPKKDAIFIKALIDGSPKRCKDAEKAFLFEIVANKRNGIDVDKFDYIARDMNAIGEKGNLSLTRLIESARVIDDQICYDIKDANQLYELCYTRFSLHKRIYNHKTAKAIEHMIVDALLAADPFLKIAERIYKPHKYVHLTEAIMNHIEASEEPELAQSRAIFERFRNRDLYKCVDYKVFSWEYLELCESYITPERIVQAARSHMEEGKDEEGIKEILDLLEVKHVIVDLAQMHYGMKEKNPLDFIKFYSKNRPNQCASAGPGDVSLLMPASFGEVLLRVYTRDVRFFGVIQEGYRTVLSNMPDALEPTHPPHGIPLTALTPPVTEAPLTPQHADSLKSSLGDLTASMMTTPTPFTNNSFTAVPRTYVPESPTQMHRRKRGGSGVKECDWDGEGSPKKRRVL